MVTHDIEKDVEPGVGTLVSGIIADVQTLLTQHLTLFQQEVQENVVKIQSAAYPFISGLSVAVVAGVTLAAAAALLLHDVMPALPAWACFGLVGVLCSGVAVSLVLTAKKEANSFHPVPEKTVQAVKEDVRCLTKN